MAFGTLGHGDEQPMAEINTTPLVDVMLVLLIIFMVTAPIFTHSVKVDLPRARSELNVERPETISIAIDAAGEIHWNDDRVDEAALTERFLQAAALATQPELHLRADRDTRYDVIARIMAEAQRSGLKKIGFVTDPSARSK